MKTLSNKTFHIPWTLNHVVAGVTAVVVGYSSALVLVIEAARTAGASELQLMSWLTAVGLGMGLTCIVYSWWYKMPIVTAWSTPGAAFLIGSGGTFTLGEVIGACFSAGLLALVAARLSWISLRLSKIPSSISAALLAGILFPFCTKVFAIGANEPLLAFVFIAVFILGQRLFAKFQMLVLLSMALAWSFAQPAGIDVTFTAPQLVYMKPEFSLTAMLSLTLPLFLISLLSQNVPGIAIIHSHGYRPPIKPILTGVATTQTVLSPVGGFTFNLAAITAAICMGEQVDQDKARRYWAGIWAGVGYLLMGLGASAVATLFTSMPLSVTYLLAGVALLPTLQTAITRMVEDTHTRQAAIMVFACTASGINYLGLNSAVWGLLIGLLTYWWNRGFHKA